MRLVAGLLLLATLGCGPEPLHNNETRICLGSIPPRNGTIENAQTRLFLFKNCQALERHMYWPKDWLIGDDQILKEQLYVIHLQGEK